MSVESKHNMADGTAEEFILAGIHLSKICSDLKYIAPTMVCFSFAIELHIKAILSSCNIDPKKEHNLHTLYSKLPNEKKDWIVKMYKETESDNSDKNFETELKKWSKTFTDIRYYHENLKDGAASFIFSNFIPNLAISLNNAYLHTKKQKRFSFPQL
jgi:hypothetical protein